MKTLQFPRSGGHPRGARQSGKRCTCLVKWMSLDGDDDGDTTRCSFIPSHKSTSCDGEKQPQRKNIKPQTHRGMRPPRRFLPPVTTANAASSPDNHHVQRPRHLHPKSEALGTPAPMALVHRECARVAHAQKLTGVQFASCCLFVLASIHNVTLCLQDDFKATRTNHFAKNV